MSTTQKPVALRLADKYELHGFLGDQRYAKDHWCMQAAAELRRQHARIEELEAQLSAIGAGGVEPLRKQAAAPQAVQAAVPDGVGFYEAINSMDGLYPTAPAHPAEGVPAQAAATQPAAQGMEAKDAARYRFLRDGDWRENDDVAPFIHLQLNSLWDEKIDAALAAQAKQGGQANG